MCFDVFCCPKGSFISPFKSYNHLRTVIFVMTSSSQITISLCEKSSILLLCSSRWRSLITCSTAILRCLFTFTQQSNICFPFRHKRSVIDKIPPLCPLVLRVLTAWQGVNISPVRSVRHIWLRDNESYRHSHEETGWQTDRQTDSSVSPSIWATSIRLSSRQKMSLCVKSLDVWWHAPCVTWTLFIQKTGSSRLFTVTFDPC